MERSAEIVYEVLAKVVHDTRGIYSQGDVTDRPCPAITIGVNSLNSTHYQVYSYLTNNPPEIPMSDNKPPYRVPSMSEIAATPRNGYNVVSTFSGAGGSCLGYRMAGFRVLWASEFIPAAQEVYKLNHPDSILDTRDIREVRPQDILDAVGMEPGELDLLDGSPPCASFSTAGKREAGWGKVKQYSDTKQRVDDLFFEYARIVEGIQPRVFIAENVSGLVKGKAKGYFKEILQALKDCGYNVTAKLLDAQWLGVPQMRQRLIFIGVRKDIGLRAAFPKPLPYQHTVREALPWAVSTLHYGQFDSFTGEREPRPATRPSEAIRATQGGSQQFWVEAETDISRYAIGDEWDKLRPGEKSDKYLQLSRAPIDGPSFSLTIAHGALSSAGVVHPTEKRRFSIAELKRIMAFPDDFQLTGTYAQQWERLGRAVPPVMMYHIAKTVQEEVLDKCKR